MSISSHINKLAAKAGANLGKTAGIAVGTIEAWAIKLPRPLADQTDQQLVEKLGKAGFNVAILALAAKFGKKPSKAGKWLSAATLAYNVGEGVAALHELVVRALEARAEMQEDIDRVSRMAANGDHIDLRGCDRVVVGLPGGAVDLEELFWSNELDLEKLFWSGSHRRP